MSDIIDLEAAKRERAERFIRSAHEFRGEMDELCDEMRDAVARLAEARDAVVAARARIERTRERVGRLRRATEQHERNLRRRRLRLITA